MMYSRRRHLILLFTVVLIALSPVAALSLYPDMQVEDPFSSQLLLEQRNFSYEIDDATRSAADTLQISLATMGKGDPLYVWFGHSGLVITDSRSGRSVMYDYGIFSFDDNFYQTFALGRLYYEVWATSAQARYDLAREEDRTVTVVTLELPPSAKLELLNFLNFNIAPENKTYLYHHYEENCSTRIRDILDKAVDGQLKAWATAIPLDMTIRDLVSLHTASSPLIDWTLNFLQSGTIDHPITLWEAMFLPEILERALLEFSYTRNDGAVIPIVSNREIIHTASEGIRTPVAEKKVPVARYAFLVSLGVALLSILTGRIMRESRFRTIRAMGKGVYGTITVLWTAAVGILSALLVFMMLASSHDVTYFNENILIATPWLLVMSVQALRGTLGNSTSERRFRRANTICALAVVTLIILKAVLFDVLTQDNWQIILTLLPLYSANSSIPFERIVSHFSFRADDSDW